MWCQQQHFLDFVHDSREFITFTHDHKPLSVVCLVRNVTLTYTPSSYLSVKSIATTTIPWNNNLLAMGNILRLESFEAEDNGKDTLTLTYFDQGIETKIILQVNQEQRGAPERMATRTIYKKAGGIWPTTTKADDSHQFNYTSLQTYGISKGFGQNKTPPIQTTVQKSVKTANEPFQLVAIKNASEPPYFILDLVDVPGTGWICTATRDRPGVATVVNFVERVNRPR